MGHLSVITQAALQTQSLWVLVLTWVLGAMAGVLMHRSHFCSMGALSDFFLMGDATRLRQWGLALAVAALGVGLMSGLAWISPLNSVYASDRLPWLSFGLGGVLFGVGMVLASGCPSKTLLRLGAGNLKSLVVLMVMGVTALATLRGLTGVWRVQWLDPVALPLPHGAFIGQTLSRWTGWSQPLSWALAGGLAGLGLLVWVLKDASFRHARNFWTGIGVGAIVLGVWWVSGVLGYVPEHPETLEAVFLGTASGRMEGMSLTAPVALWWDAFMYFSDGSKRLTTGMALALGLVMGAFASAQHEGTFRWEGFAQTEDLVMHLIGGALMGLGGVMALGCTFGQGLSGLSTLSWGSFVAVGGMVLGAWLALAWQLRRVERLA
ncbi:transporter [Limnohabitans sp. T6-5]|uniref:YeeE/YedE family protein n=1 Tax=Limnohabitans sp. T6-5 TaxID=1100724 RepID=UPI000D33856D|nr:YeeE/YedE family protein [Limnohabitans sp. T6-5]PUE08561.1 transporter [Limnohabitans sp. T6-5]